MSKPIPKRTAINDLRERVEQEIAIVSPRMYDSWVEGRKSLAHELMILIRSLEHKS
jgi:hypothetical protein